MIEGEVIHRVPIVSLTVLGPSTDFSFSAVLDTGYDGELALPAEWIATLGLEFLAVETTTLADDSRGHGRTFIADVIWDGERRQIVVLELGSTPLVGMGLLDGFRLTVEATSGEGTVRIDRLP